MKLSSSNRTYENSFKFGTNEVWQSRFTPFGENEMKFDYRWTKGDRDGYASGIISWTSDLKTMKSVQWCSERIGAWSKDNFERNVSWECEEKLRFYLRTNMDEPRANWTNKFHIRFTVLDMEAQLRYNAWWNIETEILFTRLTTEDTREDLLEETWSFDQHNVPLY